MSTVKPDFKHHIVGDDLSKDLTLVDTISHMTSRAKAILQTVLIQFMDEGQHQSDDETIHYALLAAQDIIGDIEVVMDAWHESRKPAKAEQA